HSSAVLPDGRVIIMGGEYNGGDSPVWTNMGAIYDPVANTWTSVSPPPGWSYFTNGTGVIGDSESVVLADGTFMQAACCLLPDGDALLDAASLTWNNTGAPRFGNFYQDEQGYNLLPDGKVLTLDIWTDFDFNTLTASGNPTNAEQYDPKSALWIPAGNTPVSLVDPYECGNFEIGPAVMRPDGTLVAFGGNTGCKEAASQVNPTAIFDTAAGTWSAGPNVPAVCGKEGTRYCSLPDAPAALMPNGDILFAASAGYGGSPTHFFVFTKGNTIEQVPDTVYYASTSGAYYYNFLVLPNGQILSTDFSKIAEVFTSTGTGAAAWAPTITSYPGSVNPGGYYKISGTQFNGLSQGADYGDDVQSATNYPLVRITNDATGHVFYARTANHSTMSIKPGVAGSTTFTVPGTIETGPSVLVVVANGIASKGVAIYVD
ncbi:MAG: kelch repeat-containing protein, partial [Steroidobacteraceae bacterium]